MKVEISKEAIRQDEIKYPCLMERTLKEGYQVVFLISESLGSVVYSENNKQPVGMTLNNWVMESFTPFKGSITISNDINL